MNSDAGRRAFVRQMAIGLPVFAGAAALPAEARGSALVFTGSATLASVDARIDRVLHEMAELHNRMLQRGPTPADARVVASYLRTLGAYREVSGRDARLSRAMRELIAREGTHRLSVTDPDPALAVRGLAHYGVRAASLDIGSPSPALRMKALDTIGRDGFSSQYDELSMVLMSLESVLAWDPVVCESLRQMLVMVQTMTAMMCLAAAYVPLFAPECFAASVVLAALQMFYVLMQC
jgi:hypothetical protein